MSMSEERRERKRARDRERYRERMADPEYREQRNARKRERAVLRRVRVVGALGMVEQHVGGPADDGL